MLHLNEYEYAVVTRDGFGLVRLAVYADRSDAERYADKLRIKNPGEPIFVQREIRHAHVKTES